MTDSTTPMTVTQQSDEFNENLLSKIPELTRHYTAKQQTRYLKQSEENVQSVHYIILVDFSENYSFILRDAIQCFH
jgi:hypothetical protein